MSEPLSFLLKLVNFAVMLGILAKFAARPLKDFLEKRRTSVKEALDEAGRLLDEAEHLKSLYEARLAGLDEEMEAFRTAAIAEAEKEQAAIVAEARALAARIREQAKLAYDQEMKDAMVAVKARTTARTLEAAEAAIRRHFTEADHRAMVDEFIARLKEQP